MNVDAQVLENKRLDHHGIVAGVMDDLGLQKFFDQEVSSPGETVSAGTAIGAMVLNGLGFSNKPLSLCPEFFTNVPVEELLGPGVSAESLNRHRLGRVLDDLYNAGASELFSKFALKAAEIESVNLQKQVNDTTTFSTTGDCLNSPDEDDSVTVTYGHSKDHRPDLKQVVHEMVVACDGGLPLHCKTLDGNSSDTKIFRQRVSELKKQFSMNSEALWVADSKLYSKETIEALDGVRFLTRVPETSCAAKDVLDKAFEIDEWMETGGLKTQVFDVEHYNVSQKWVVCLSDESFEKQLHKFGKRQDKEWVAVEKEVAHLCRQEFDCEGDAQKTLKKIVKKWKLIELESCEVEKVLKFSKKGRPKKGEEPSKEAYRIKITFKKKDFKEAARKKAAFILGTSVKTLSAQEVITSYKEQGSVERGFRFLKDPFFFTSAFFLKKPSRIQSLLMIMTLSLLIYSIAQRRIRKALKESSETIGNQIGVQTQNPTLRRIFQLFEGINIVTLKVGKLVKKITQGVKEIHIIILKHLSGKALGIYTPQKAYS